MIISLIFLAVILIGLFISYIKNKNTIISEKRNKEIGDEKMDNVNDLVEEYAEALVKEKETEICLSSILTNCSAYKEIHNLAYELNSEYRVLWDNLDEKVKKKITLGRNLMAVQPTFYKWVFRLSTFGISYLIELPFKKREYQKNKDYVTSEAFTNGCILVNTNLNFYNKEN